MRHVHACIHNSVITQVVAEVELCVCVHASRHVSVQVPTLPNVHLIVLFLLCSGREKRKIELKQRIRRRKYNEIQALAHTGRQGAHLTEV